MSSIVIIYTTSIRYKIANRINGVMVSVLALSAVAHGFEHRSGQSKIIKLVFVASPLVLFSVFLTIYILPNYYIV